jgi:hypothetical protein
MEGDKMVLIAYHMLDCSKGAYLEWLVNELMMIANKIKYKDACLVMFPANAITHEPDSLAYLWSLFISSCQVSLAEYN